MPALSSKGAVKLGVGRIVAGAVVLIVSFAGALWAFDAFLPGGRDRPPALAAMPPLKPATRTSTITVPVAVALTAIRDAMEQQAPRELAGKHDNALNQLLGKADISWTLARGPIAVAGPRREGLAIASPLNGMLRVTGEIANQGGNIGGALGSLINSGVGRRLQKLTDNTLDQRADLRANVTITARPIIDNHWRIDPHLGAEVVMGESALSIAGVKLSMPTSSRRCSSTASTRPSRPPTLHAQETRDCFASRASQRWTLPLRRRSDRVAACLSGTIDPERGEETARRRKR